MKEITASLNNLRISPRKVRLVAGLIRGVSVAEARQQLAHNPKRAAKPVLKLLNSAVANAENNFNMETTPLSVKSITVGPGSVLKRYRPRAFGRATTIRKRMSHVRIILEGPESAEKKSTGEIKTRKGSSHEVVDKKEIDKKVRAQKEVDAKDMEKQEPQKSGETQKTSGHKPAPVDPRREGHERKNQHIDKTQKAKPSIKKTVITRTQNK